MDALKPLTRVLDAIAAGFLFFGALVVGVLHAILIIIIMIARGAWRS